MGWAIHFGLWTLPEVVDPGQNDPNQGGSGPPHCLHAKHFCSGRLFVLKFALSVELFDSTVQLPCCMSIQALFNGLQTKFHPHNWMELQRFTTKCICDLSRKINANSMPKNTELLNNVQGRVCIKGDTYSPAFRAENRLKSASPALRTEFSNTRLRGCLCYLRQTLS